MIYQYVDGSTPGCSDNDFIESVNNFRQCTEASADILSLKFRNKPFSGNNLP